MTYIPETEEYAKLLAEALMEQARADCDKCEDGWLKLTYDEMVGPILRGCPYCGAGQDNGEKGES